METTAIAGAKLLNSSQPKPRGRPHGPIKPVPFTRADLDSRTAAAKLWDNMATSITADLGGEDNLSTIQRTLINAFCAVSIQLTDLNTQALLGKPVSLSELSLAASTLVRLAVILLLFLPACALSLFADRLDQTHEARSTTWLC